MVGIDGDVIDPAAMAVMADQYRRDDGAVITAYKHRRIGFFSRQRNVAGRVVPFARRSAALPQRDDIGDVAVFNRCDGQCAAGRNIHSTLPGFMMP